MASRPSQEVAAPATAGVLASTHLGVAHRGGAVARLALKGPGGRDPRSTIGTGPAMARFAYPSALFVSSHRTYRTRSDLDRGRTVCGLPRECAPRARRSAPSRRGPRAPGPRGAPRRGRVPAPEEVILLSSSGVRSGLGYAEAQACRPTSQSRCAVTACRSRSEAERDPPEARRRAQVTRSEPRGVSAVTIAQRRYRPPLGIAQRPGPGCDRDSTQGPSRGPESGLCGLCGPGPPSPTRSLSREALWSHYTRGLAGVSTW